MSRIDVLTRPFTKTWPIWLTVFPSGDFQFSLWVSLCGMMICCTKIISDYITKGNGKKVKGPNLTLKLIVVVKVYIQFNCGNFKKLEVILSFKQWNRYLSNLDRKHRIGLSSTSVATCVIKQAEMVEFKKKISNAWRWDGVGMMLISAHEVRS